MNKRLPWMMWAAITPLAAQDLMDPLMVTASRVSEKESDAPYSTEYLTAEYLRDNGRRTLPEALQYTPGVLVQKTAHGHGSPFIRGFTGRQNLLLVDGIRINNSTWRGGPVQYWNTVDPLSIDHIELIRSQGSVLYGSDAAGGTLNAFTKTPDFRNRPDGAFYQGGMGFYEYRSNGQGSHIGRVEAEGGIGGSFGILLGASVKEFGDIEDSAIGRMQGTGYPEQDFDLKAQWALSADSTLTFASYYINQDDVSRWHRTIYNPGWTHGSHVTAPGKYTANTYDQERSMTYLRYEGENPVSGAFIQRWSATLSYQSTRDSEFQNRNPDADDVRYADIDIDTIGVDVQFESPLGPGALVYGFDFYHDEVDSSGIRTDAARSTFRESLPIADDSNYDLLGVFSQYTWNPFEPLEVTVGGRYTHAHAKLGRFYDATTGAIETDESEDWDAVVGSIRGLYRVNPCWSIFGGVSQAFRAPNLDDLSGNKTAKSGTNSLGSVDVDPEYFLTFETGVRHTTETTSLQAAVFYTDVNDLITGVDFDNNGDGVVDGSVTTNAAEAYSYGVELEGAWRFHPQWTVSGFAAWQDGREKSPVVLGGPLDERPMTRSYPLTGSVALRWSDPGEKYWVEGRVLAAAREDRITAADQASDDQRIPTGGTPAYVVASLRAGWTVNEHLDLIAGIENITDEDYRNHGSGQNEPGIGGILSARISW
ncbi:MAG: TonB-dependent receptor [Akkermansiaceae bacterium]|nr:TonB-dependent receptor [Akkermansiaceae bacterium]